MKKKNNLTELVFILDRSGSMSGLESDTIGGFNAMIAKQKKEDGEAYVSTVLFDNVSEVLHDRVSLRDIHKMTAKDYTVRGCTALIDAIGGAIKHIRNIHKYARPEDVPAHTMFIITTDGQENVSHRFSSDEVKKMIEHQKANMDGNFSSSVQILMLWKRQRTLALSAIVQLTTMLTTKEHRSSMKPYLLPFVL